MRQAIPWTDSPLLLDVGMEKVQVRCKCRQMKEGMRRASSTWKLRDLSSFHLLQLKRYD